MLGRITPADREAIDVALASVGLSGFQTRGIDTLSGGQLQRALFARVLLQDARLILLDEPFNAIDTRTVARPDRIIQRWHGEERTVLVVLHDLDLVREHFPQTLLLARRPVAWGDTRGDAESRRTCCVARRMNEAADDDAPWCEESDGRMSLSTLIVGPFVEFEFMRRALIGTSVLSLSACPVGVFLMLRRMSLSGDAMAHAILPGAAVGFLVSGLELLPMTFGGLVAGLAVALVSGAVARSTIQKEDASLAAFYLISLALGVLLVSLKGSSIDLMHVLFGTVLALERSGALS